MPCYSLRMDGKHVGFMCGDLGPHCRECAAPADNLCDYPVGEGKTCDRSICDEHSHEVGPDLHYCAAHYQSWKEWRAAGGESKVLSNVERFKG